MGHPDKLADRISDSILDACLAQDAHSRVACETLVATGVAVVAGEISTKAQLDYQDVVRSAIRRVGYTDDEFGINASTCSVMVALDKQSPDIAQGVDATDTKDVGAGDQGIMFGYACNQTPEFMPLPIALSHRIMSKLADLRFKKAVDWLRPDAKSQVTLEYDGKRPVRVDAVVVSSQHDPDVDQDVIREWIVENAIMPSIPEELLDDDVKYYVNPTGKFAVGGPQGDAGLTGRKIIVDTYGGWARHGGGAFSGKDATKVDRSAAYTSSRRISRNRAKSNSPTRSASPNRSASWSIFTKRDASTKKSSPKRFAISSPSRRAVSSKPSICVARSSKRPPSAGTSDVPAIPTPGKRISEFLVATTSRGKKQTKSTNSPNYFEKTAAPFIDAAFSFL